MTQMISLTGRTPVKTQVAEIMTTIESLLKNDSVFDAQDYFSRYVMDRDLDVVHGVALAIKTNGQTDGDWNHLSNLITWRV
jgi:hypothetical protein